MTTKAEITDFLSQRTLAVVGASRQGNKFGNMAYKELRAKGYKLFPVHPQAETIEGDKCYPSLAELPEKPGGVLVVVPPTQSEKVVQEAAKAGIQRVWLQQGAESEAAVRYCQENGMSVVQKQCILMFAEPASFGHAAHRWVWKVFGKLPR